ncbi:hypothetical protein ACFE04_025289 [Oxalis oulophora]
MHAKKSTQIIIRSPNPQFLTLNPSKTLTFHDLKRSILTPSQNPNLFYLTHNGKPLNDSTIIQSLQLSPLSTLILQSRVLGGGGDGGSTCAESRDCYLNMYAEKKPEKCDPYEQKLSKWLNCALSNEPLEEPCVVDRLGNMFNKQALVEALLGKKLPKEFSYIKGLKDMLNIKLHKEKGIQRFQCPITGLEFNGKYGFLVLKGCGHVLSVKALKEVKMDGLSCLVCRQEFTEEDKIVINGNEEEVEVLRERMEEEMKSKLKDKKPKKVKNGDNGGKMVSGTKRGVEVNGVEENAKAHGKKFKVADLAPANADKELYASLFTSSKKKSNLRETYMCRSLPLGRN